MEELTQNSGHESEVVEKLGPMARKIIQDTIQLINKGWTQNTLARNKKGEAVSICSDQAVCWCISGALYRAASNGREFYLPFIRQYMIKKLGEELYRYNDKCGQTKEEVIAFLQTLL